MTRACYRCLLWLHPPVFRREFGGEMLWIFDEAACTQGSLPFFRDGIGSLARQWLLRSGWWKLAMALALASVQVVLGGFGMLLFGQRHLANPANDAAIANFAEFAHYGSIARQPLTIGILMYLAVFVTGGLVILVIGVAFWHKTFAARRRPAYSRLAYSKVR